MIEEFVELIPDCLYDRSGKVFYSGRGAFGSRSDLYILGINPGGDPKDRTLKRETVCSHTNLILHDYPDNWSAYRDESWSDQEPGCDPIQESLLHLFDGLNMDPGEVPSSNLYFPRSSNAEDLRVRHFKKCWNFHKAVIKKLRIRVVVCYGRQPADFVRRRVDASPHRRKRYRDHVWQNADGITVIYARHPSRGGSWKKPKNDPTDLVIKFLDEVN